MDRKKIKDELKKAIKSRLTVQIKIKHGLGDNMEIDMNPYIVGSDFLQYDFVWGFTPHNRTFYKLTLAFVQSLELTEKKFNIEPGTVYLYAIEEEHSETVDGLNVFGASNVTD